MSNSLYSEQYPRNRRTRCRIVHPFGMIILLLISTPAFFARAATVTNVGDSGPGTLRALLATGADSDVIDFDLQTPATITLTSGELVVDKNLSILGPGPRLLTIDGGFPTTTNRAFRVTGAVTVWICNLTITNGRGGEGGGGILNENSTLTVSNCVISGNSAAEFGGGILNLWPGNRVSILTILNSTLASNTAGFGGGAIANYDAELTVFGCLIYGNSTTNFENGFGGGVFNDTGTAEIALSTFSNNSASYDGGAVCNVGVASGGKTQVRINSCTFDRNSARMTGGVLNQSLDADVPGAYLYLGNSVFRAGDSGANVGKTRWLFSQGYNLSDDAAGGDGETGPGGCLNADGDIRNTDPLLDPAGLKDNGGLTQTIALQPASPAINKGNRAAIPDLAFNFDQRGVPRPIGDPAIAGGDGSDIGAFELVPSPLITATERMRSDLRITFYGSLSGKNYELESRTNLTVGTWIGLPGSTAGTGGSAQFTVPNAFGQSQQFYRIHELP